MKKNKTKENNNRKILKYSILVWFITFIIVGMAFAGFTSKLETEGYAIIQKHIYDYVYINKMSIYESNGSSSINYSFLDHEIKANIIASSCNNYITYKLEIVNETSSNVYITKTSLVSIINSNGNDSSSFSIEVIDGDTNAPVIVNSTQILAHSTKIIYVKIKNNCNGDDTSATITANFEYSLYRYFDLTINCNNLPDANITMTTSEGTFTGIGSLTHQVMENDIVSYEVSRKDYITKTDAYTMGSANYTINVNLKNKFVVTFNANKGNVSPTNKEVIFSETYGDLPTPTRTGYTFKGWTTYPTAYGYGEFNGSTDYYILSRDYMYTDKISIHLEAYMDNWSNFSSANARLISCTESGGWNIETTNGTNISYAMYDSGISAYNNATSNVAWSSLSSGWHTFDMVFSGAGNYLIGYLDGVEIARSNTFSGGIGYNSENIIFVGAEAGSNQTTPYGNYFTGKIKNVVISHSNELITLQNVDSTTIMDKEYNHTLYASWAPNKYTITFNANSGSVNTSSKTVYYDNPIGTLPNASKSNTTFLGWFSDTYKDNPINYYLDKNQDVATSAAYGNRPYNHYINYGQNEGRRISEYISSDVYKIAGNTTLYAGFIYEWKKYNTNVSYLWDTTLIASNVSTTATLTNSYTCMVKDLESYVQSDGIHWPKYFTGVASTFKEYIGYYAIANSDSLRTHISASEGEITTAYMKVSSVTQRIIGVAVTGDIYRISNIRPEYSQGSDTEEVYYSCSNNEYPSNGKHTDGYWYILQ